MKIVKLLAVAAACCATSAYAADPVESDMTCAQVQEQYVATADAAARYADLKGSCSGVYTINDALYVKASAVVRSVRGNEVTLYIPATDHTFKIDTDPASRVLMGNSKVRPRDLDRGDEISIYLSVDKLATRLDSVALATADGSTEEIIEEEVEEVAALPTTG